MHANHLRVRQTPKTLASEFVGVLIDDRPIALALLVELLARLDLPVFLIGDAQVAAGMARRLRAGIIQRRTAPSAPDTGIPASRADRARATLCGLLFEQLARPSALEAA